MTKVDKLQDRQKLANLITQWNQDHYDLFELSAPNEVITHFTNTNFTVLFVCICMVKIHDVFVHQGKF